MNSNTQNNYIYRKETGLYFESVASDCIVLLFDIELSNSVGKELGNC